MIRTFIYDLQVFAHMITHHAGEDASKEELRLHILSLFNRGPDCIPYEEHQVVLVDDSKPYWRNFYFEEYKAGRPAKPEIISTIRELIVSYATKNNIPLFNKDHYEADDLAGGFVRLKSLLDKFTDEKTCKIGLYTVDSDWMQLVNKDVIWYNTGPWEPRVRGIAESLQWIKKRLKVTANHPQDIVAIKSIKGDKSDNLPPGSPTYLIDLLNPPVDWRITDDKIFVKKATKLLTEPVVNSSWNNYKIARQLIAQKGYLPMV